MRDNLTPTEQRIADLAAQGLTNRQIAEKLGIAEGTVRTHISKILIKLNIKSRKELWQATGIVNKLREGK